MDAQCKRCWTEKFKVLSDLKWFDGIGKGTFRQIKPEKKYPTNVIMAIFGSMKVRLPFIMSTMAIGFDIGLVGPGTLSRRIPVFLRSKYDFLTLKARSFKYWPEVLILWDCISTCLYLKSKHLTK